MYKWQQYISRKIVTIRRVFEFTTNMPVKVQIKGALVETAKKTKVCLLDVQRRDKRGQGVDNGRWRRGLVHQDGGGSWTTLNHWSIKMEEDSCSNCRTPWPLVHLVQAWPTPRSLRTLHHVTTWRTPLLSNMLLLNWSIFLQGGFFNWSARFSVPKWKNLLSQRGAF